MECRLNGRSGSYYAILNVPPNATLTEIRSAYRKLAKKWHPDRCGKELLHVEEAKRRFQQLQEAYQVLSDERKRALYDVGVYDPNEEEEEVEGFAEFVQEMMGLMDNARREEKEYSLEELQGMLSDIAKGFDFPPTTRSPARESPRSSKRFRFDSDPMLTRKSYARMAGMEVL